MLPEEYLSHFCNDKNNKYFMIFDGVTKAGIQLEVPYETKYLLDSAQIKNCIYFTGGGIPATDEHGEQFLNVAMKLTIDSDRDTTKDKLANMNVARANHTMVAVGEKKLYVIGGCNTKAEIPACEVYDISQKNWKNCATLNERKMWVCVCVVDERYLYTFGGSTNLKQKESSIIEFLDTEDSSATLWTKLELNSGKDLWSKCLFIGAHQISSDCVLIFGGLVDKNEVNDSYYFNPKTKDLAKGPSLEKKDAFYRTKPLLCKDELIVVGSNEGDMHMYNITEKKWTLRLNKVWNPDSEVVLKSETY